MEIFKRDAGSKKVSVEMELIRAEEEDGIIIMKDFVYAGICLLGDLITEASPGANIQILSFAEKNKECRKAFMAELDDSIFGELLTFPYKSLKNINPALKGIKPPLTLKQANDIAAQADAIGTDETKNGWAIAISHFKKTHVVKNGRWVKKEDINSVKNKKQFKNKFSLNSSQIIEILNNALSEYRYGKNNWRKYWVNAFDEDYVYIHDYEDEKTYRAKYNIDSEVGEVYLEDKEEVIKGNYKPIGDDDNNMLKDNFDIEMLMTLFEDDEKACDILRGEFDKEDEDKDFAIILGTMLAKLKKEALKFDKIIKTHAVEIDKFKEIQEEIDELKKLEDKNKELVNEIEELKKFQDENKQLKLDNENLQKFKSDIETKQFEFIVNSVLKEIEDSVEIPETTLEEMKTRSREFTLENIDVWKNECLASAFSFTVKDKDLKKEKIEQYGFPWGTIKDGKKHSVWDD